MGRHGRVQGAAGLANRSGPVSPDALRRRFRELAAVGAFAFVGLAVALVVFSRQPTVWASVGVSAETVRLGMVAFAAAFAVYLVQQVRHLRMLRTLVGQHAELASRLSSQLSGATDLVALGESLSGASNVDELVDVALREGLRLVDADAGTLLLFQDAELRPRGTLGASFARGAAVSPKDSFLDRVLADGEPVPCSGGAAVRQAVPYLLTAREMQSALAVPVTSGNVRVGVLIAMRADGAFQPHDVELLVALGTHLGGGLRRMDAVETARSEAAELSRMALYDQLTGLANRTRLRQRAEAALAATVDGVCSAVLYLDLDGFKQVNDRLGHAAGDRLLQSAARRITEQLRPTDVAARLGGDEFAVVLHGLESPPVAESVAGRILRALAEPFLLGDAEAFVTASIGLALAGVDGDDIDTLLEHADAALYSAKTTGKSRVVRYVAADDGMAAAAVHTADLERALQRGEFALDLQPFQRLDGGTVAAAEALLRWQHPERGRLLPGQFLRQLVDTGLIVQAGGWVLDEACRVLRATWDDEECADLEWVTVNVSAQQLRDAGFTGAVLGALERHRLPGSALVLDVTEDVLVNGMEDTLTGLQRLRDRGVRVAIDDFGTGYASLTYLLEMPIDMLKIDRSFVERLVTRPESRSVLRAVVTMAQSLGISTVAEGVESAEEMQAVRALHCDYVQGRFTGVPASPAALHELLRVARRYGEGATPVPGQRHPVQSAQAQVLAEIRALAAELDQLR